MIKLRPLTYRTLGSAMIVSLLYACAVGPKFETPVIESPPVFLNANSEGIQDSVFDLRWWELFNDPSLDSLIKLALSENKDILIAASRLEQAKYNLGYNRADFYPKFNYGAGVSRGNFAGGILSFDETKTVYNVNGQLNWEIDFWGKFRRQTESAKAEMLATEYGVRTLQIGLITEVARNYFLLLDYISRYEISQRTFDSRDSGHKIIQARYANGIIPEIDVNQSQIQLAISRAAIPTYDRLITNTQNNLSLLLGRNPGSIQVGKGLFEQELKPDIPSGLPSELLIRRPDILSSAEQLHAQTAKIGVAQALRYPSISLTGLFGAVSDDLSGLTTGKAAWSAGVNLMGPLFHFNKNKRRVQIEREKTEQAVLTYEKTVINAFAEVENSLKSIETLNEELLARKEQLEAATNAETLSFERYNKGVTSYLEVLENQRYSFEAALLYSETYQNLLNAYISLYKSLGGGWISEEELNSAESQQGK